MNYAMALDYQNCINCKACEVACKEENNVQLGIHKQRIWVGIVEGVIFNKPYVNLYPSQCNHCINAPCVSVCPTHASYYEDGGIVQIDKQKCILCKGCMQACPYDARFVDDTIVSVDKCTFCSHRSLKSKTTACEDTCPTKVRVFGDIDDENSEITKLLKQRSFFFLKENYKTFPKLFYLVPKDSSFARQSISHDINIYTWDSFKKSYDKMKNKRSKEWKS